MKSMALVLGLTVIIGVTGHVQAGDELTGIAKLACEARLCLSTGSPPPECSAALAYYYALKGRTGAKTAAKRQAFLNKCPMVGQVNATDADTVAMTVVDADGVEVSLGVVEAGEGGEMLLSACGACGDAAVGGSGETP